MNFPDDLLDLLQTIYHLEKEFMPESNVILNEINKVFIPCRTVLEMEILTSLLLENKNFDDIKHIPETQPTSEQLIDAYHVSGIDALERIISHFTNVILNKLKPIVMYQRDFKQRYRMSNVDAYSKTRLCLFLALHRLKLKFLVIKRFMQELVPNELRDTNIIEEFYKFYYEKNEMNLKLMLSTKRMSERVKNLMNRDDVIENSDLLNALSFKVHLNNNERIKFIMRDIKASIFICRLMFAKMDVITPFSKSKELNVNPERMMVSQDFIPELIPAISKCIRDNNPRHLHTLLEAFDFMMENVFESINNAFEIASGGGIMLDGDETMFSLGNVFSV
ncbi:MAG: hypothetical protein BAJALOKI3v1_250035 [Promethearchaeota archaeon]|nr:MAG: hypothetical protein BAJALOKI3v1_250035 [Candidatus Lokiarchaeota archaeon]